MSQGPTVTSPRRVQPLWRRCIRRFLYGVGLGFLLVIIIVLVLSSGGDAAVQKARAEATTQDANWRWVDAFKKLPVVTENNDIGKDIVNALGLAMTPGPWPCSKHTEFNSVLNFNDPRGYTYLPAYSCNHRLREPEWTALKAAMDKMSDPFALASFGDNKTGIRYLPKLDLKWGYLVEEYQAVGLMTLAEAYRQRAVYQCLSNEADSWKSLSEALRLNDFLQEPTFRTAMWRAIGIHNVVLAEEYLLAQKEYTDDELATFQERLTQRLENPTSLKAALFFHRATADTWLDQLAADDPELKKAFPFPMWLSGPSLKHSLAECITMMTTLLKLEKVTCRNVEKWLYDGYLQKVHEGEYLQLLNYPLNIFLIYQLPRIKKSLYDCISEQTNVRLGLLALACERYRLKTGAFPGSIKEAKSMLPKETLERFEEGMGTIHLQASDFGLLLSDRPLSSVDSSSLEQFSMNTNTEKHGFKLYHKVLRGKAAPPPVKQATEEEPALPVKPLQW